MRLKRFWPLFLAGLLVSAVAVFAAGIAITDRLEQDNEFCIACHLSERKRLHQEKFTTFSPVQGWVTTLAAAHYVGAKPKAFTCIDCHNGASINDKLLIKAQAARDTVAYFMGAFKEPDHMRFALGNRLCLNCHITGGRNPDQETAFHNASHHTDLPLICYECHTVHPRADFDTGFLRRETVQPLCDNCHARLES